MGTGEHRRPGSRPPVPTARLGPARSRAGIILSAAVWWLAAAGVADAQPDPPTTPRNIPPGKPLDNEAFGKLVDGLIPIEGDFTVYLGQARIVALKQELTARPVAAAGAAPANPAALLPAVAIGDEAVAEITILTTKQIRVTGKRLGTTDGSFTMPDGRTIPFTVYVKADVSRLNDELRQIFPASKVEVRQIGNCLVVEGTAPTQAESDLIVQVIRAGTNLAPRGSDKPAEPTAPPRFGPGLADGPAPASAPAAPQAAPSKTADQVISLIRVPAAEPAAKVPVPVSELLAKLNTRLKQLFPNSAVVVSQVVGGLTVEGVAPEFLERDLILEIVRASANLPSSAPGGQPADAIAAVSGQGRIAADRVVDLIHVPIAESVEDLIVRLNKRLASTFPNSEVNVSQIGTGLVVEGVTPASVERDLIVEVIRASTNLPPLDQANKPSASSAGTAAVNAGAAAVNAGSAALNDGGAAPPAPAAAAASAPARGKIPADRVVNLIRIRVLLKPRAQGSQQVLLKVRIAELNRTAFRQIGANALGYDSKSGSIFGSQIGGPITATASAGGIGSTLLGNASSSLTSAATVFGIFQNSNFEVYLNALRRNSVLKILAEPNLVALNGHQASFLAGGEFPIPVPQVGASGVASTITVLFKKFGVSLDFLPMIVDGDVIRLTVDPVVSSIDFSVGTTLVAGGSPVPGLNTRQAHTTVEMKQGQTLAIAGLLQLSLDGTTNRVPGLGDLPILGPFFSNTTSNRVEKELVVLVTPYLIEPLEAGQVLPGPGDEVGQPNDLEFYFLNRIEGRTGRDFRGTTDGADPLRIGRALHLERKFVRGPMGFSD